jgi:hypothetical protein
MKTCQPAIPFLLLAVALTACGPRAKICPQRIGYTDFAPNAPIHATVMINECTEKGPNSLSIVLYQAGAEMQMHTHQRAVTVKAKPDGKVRKNGAPFATFEWSSDSEIEVFYDETAELVNAKPTVEGGAVKAVAVKYTPVHCYKEGEDAPEGKGKRSNIVCAPEKPDK